MKYTVVCLIAVFACALGAEHQPRWVLPRLPLKVLLSGRVPMYDDSLGKIVGGATVPRNSLPFLGLMERKGLLGNWNVYCGGSVIGPQTILCAAHCTQNLNLANFRVVLGDHDRTVAEGGEQICTISRITSHLNYNSDTYENDVSLIFCSNVLDLSAAQVGAINLPTVQNEDTAPGTDVTVAGWGATTEGGSVSNVPMKVTVPVVSDADCNAPTSYNGAVFESMICAGVQAGGVDSCQGDSGGPLFTGTGTSATQVGIVSWGNGCARPEFYGVYTQVSYFIDWIAQNNTP